MVAIGLALITKEVYSSLFIGIVVGAVLYSGFSFEGTMNHVLSGGIISVLSDGYNVGILVFLVILGAMVALMNKAGGSAAFGDVYKRQVWAGGDKADEKALQKTISAQRKAPDAPILLIDWTSDSRAVEKYVSAGTVRLVQPEDPCK